MCKSNFFIYFQYEVQISNTIQKSDYFSQSINNQTITFYQRILINNKIDIVDSVCIQIHLPDKSIHNFAGH